MKLKSVISLPENKSEAEIIQFFSNAGFIFNKDYEFISHKGVLYIKALTQIILAQDALAFGFNKVELN